MKDEIQWNHEPPPGISWATHKFTLIDAIEQASNTIDTDYVRQREFIIVGRQGRVVLATLPHFVSGHNACELCPEVDGKALIGSIGHRQVLFDRDPAMNDKIIVTNKKSECPIKLRQDHVVVQQ